MQWGAGATNRRNLLNQEIAAASPASTGISTGTSTPSLGSSAATPAQPVLESLAPSPANQVSNSCPGGSWNNSGGAAIDLHSCLEQDNSGSGLTVFPLPTVAAPHSGQQTPAAALTPITSTGTNGGGSTAGENMEPPVVRDVFECRSRLMQIQCKRLEQGILSPFDSRGGDMLHLLWRLEGRTRGQTCTEACNCQHRAAI